MESAVTPPGFGGQTGAKPRLSKVSSFSFFLKMLASHTLNCLLVCEVWLADWYLMVLSQHRIQKEFICRELTRH